MPKPSDNHLGILLAVSLLFSACNKSADIKTDGPREKPGYGFSADRKPSPAQETDTTLYRSIEGFKATRLGELIHTGNLEKVKALLEDGASFEECLTDETYVFDALYAALAFGKPDILDYLIGNNHFSDINKAYTEESESPLTMASSFREDSVAYIMAELLISKGANVNGVGESGGEETKMPLMEAVKQGNIPLVKLLLARGAAKDFASPSGASPLSKAEEIGNAELVELLE